MDACTGFPLWDMEALSRGRGHIHKLFLRIFPSNRTLCPFTVNLGEGVLSKGRPGPAVALSVEG